MNASLVYDGGKKVHVPQSMGTPCDDQLTGNPLENLGEVASRICYDSLGTDPEGRRLGRSAELLHEHILEVKNLSVYEHCNFTVRLAPDVGERQVSPALAACANRKGVFISMPGDGEPVEVTANFRSVIEWEQNTKAINNVFMTGGVPSSELIGEVLRHAMTQVAPVLARLIGWKGREPDLDYKLLGREELNEDQAWISLWLSGSRGFTHEQVRHRFAMSQRSTRYVDEGESSYVLHPLIDKYLDDESVKRHERDFVCDLMMDSERADKKTYAALVEALVKYNVARKMDRTSARKQARGAARGYLGNALASEMIFSAPVSGWKHILRQRKCAAADAEIRQIYSPALDALKSSAYGEMFAEFDTIPSPDGIGTVLKV